MKIFTEGTIAGIMPGTLLTSYEKIKLKDLGADLFDKAGVFLDSIEDKLTHKYGKNDYNDTIKLVLFGNVMTAIGGNLSDKAFLDLGCGSTSYGVGSDNGDYSNREDRDFEPWLPRILYELGVHVIGVDIGNLAGEEFEHYCIDLTSKNALDFIPDKSVDYVHTRMFFDSPRLRRFRDGRNTKANILPQIERVLKLDGTYLDFSY